MLYKYRFANQYLHHSFHCNINYSRVMSLTYLYNGLEDAVDHDVL